MKKDYSILFIGNSYTYYNDMPIVIFKEFAEAAGYNVDITAITKGAHKLSQFADPSDDYGSKVEAALTSGKKYDYVILQEQSIRPITEDVNDFYSAVRNLVSRVNKTGATPILYSTWGRNDGSETLDEYGWSNESMTWKLASSYQFIADELDIDVAHVGIAFYNVHTAYTSVNLYDPDKSHPSYQGSYLAAATLFSKIFKENPIGISYYGSLNSDDANILCTAAKNVVFESVLIPEKYKIHSKDNRTK